MPRNSPRKIVVGINDLASTHPDLCLEADGWDPCNFSAGMARKVNWKCSKGHTWEARIQQRAIGVGCPFCANSGRRALAGETDLATTHPEIALSAYEWDPKNYVAGSGKKQKWLCERGHVYEATIVSRTYGVNCVICSNNQVLSGFNDLGSRNPEMASEANGWDPKTVLFSSTKKMSWKCRNSHIWEVSVVSRFKYKTGCPFCSGHRVIKGETDLFTLRPDLASEAFNWDPTSYKVGSKLKLSWKCPKGHVYKATINDRSRKLNARGCPYCSGKKVLVGFNDIKTTHPDKSKMAFGWDPTKYSFGMVVKLEWKCPKGHIWKQSPNSVCSSKFGCPVCANLEIRYLVNDLKTLNPILASQAHSWDPTKYGAQSSRIMSWKCSLGHTWRASIANRTRHNTGCPVCAGQKVWPGFNDLQTKFPEIAKQAEGWDPTVVLAGGHRKRLWRCENNHTWKTGIRSRVEGRGCPSCAKFGFDPNLDAYLYLFESEEKNMLQIGITNSPKNRMRLHRQRGWKLLDLLGPIDGLLARNWESSILEYVSSKGAIMGKESEEEKFDGYTEAWLKPTFDISNLRTLLEQIRNNDF